MLNKESRSTAERILLRFKTHGAASTAILAQELNITVEAVRLQIQKLLTDDLIEGLQESSMGVGRPKQSWKLSAAGNARFPDSHAYLTVQLIGSIQQLFGEEGLNRLITKRETEMLHEYRQACQGVSSIAGKLKRIAAIRLKEGYMARVEKQGKDWLLIEDHCPICAAAQSCQKFCRSELQLFQETLGGQVLITRQEHLFTGARRCVYRISKNEESMD
ncbi:metalloregulator ArsR/SmtB family transcription factor [Methylobacter sp. S3L5C]|uniref:helix-turn-helix transcriptional regulator n=1 Tax=Methylobacter sp. S3L5C TaxID=2839024 RepID=UPI001FACDDED|nr:metalloregulator ArsR/SmtB family transcription factor [Methylobacter sp. S3L5C]UOA07131.1 transcriptional regulator [Methylobacter sp. S3L5C]